MGKKSSIENYINDWVKYNYQRGEKLVKRFNKTAQTISVDTYLAIGLFLVAIIFFFALIGGLSQTDDNLQKDSSMTSHKLREGDIFGDGKLDINEEAALVNMDCEELKELFETQKDICIYFKDAEGNVVPMTNGTIKKYGIGCEGIVIGNKTCGTLI